ncbi:hypothetical protein Tco_0380504 [Tanacetum coccineum]
MQSTTQSKAPNDKKSKKKKIQSLFYPKTATADILESLDASDVAEEVANHPSTDAIKKEKVVKIRVTPDLIESQY